jgi:hypothetical protein
MIFGACGLHDEALAWIEGCLTNVNRIEDWTEEQQALERVPALRARADHLAHLGQFDAAIAACKEAEMAYRSSTIAAREPIFFVRSLRDILEDLVVHLKEAGEIRSLAIVEVELQVLRSAADPHYPPELLSSIVKMCRLGQSRRMTELVNNTVLPPVPIALDSTQEAPIQELLPITHPSLTNVSPLNVDAPPRDRSAFKIHICLATASLCVGWKYLPIQQSLEVITRLLTFVSSIMVVAYPLFLVWEYFVKDFIFNSGTGSHRTVNLN